MKFDITKTVEKIAMQAKENQEEYIFETIQPYCENILQIKINKEELKRIILNGVQKQQPCEDCISREATIDALWKALYEYENKTEKQFIDSDELDIADWSQHRVFVQNMSDIDRQTILNLPSVTPQPKVGKWNYVTHYARRYRVCSECNAEKEDDRATGWNFCPNCGADMENGED